MNRPGERIEKLVTEKPSVRNRPKGLGISCTWEVRAGSGERFPRWCRFLGVIVVQSENQAELVVLVVEDDCLIRYDIAEFMRAHGWLVLARGGA
jgi:hypothetical protein